MLEKFVDVTSKNGPIPCFFVAPDDQHEWPAIVFYMDAPGIREELRNMARRIAKHGYACILPDLYHRYGELRFKTHQRPEATTAIYLAAYHGLTDDDINDDTAAIIGYLEAQPQIQQGAIGSVGFCMSGRFARYEMDVFDGVDHGYAFVERAPYDAAAAELSWDKVFAQIPV